MISIAMATYNGEKYLKEQIDSILNQTIQDFEIVVCDDCSTDKTFGILQEYAKNDSRFNIYINDVNLGFKKNFEKALSLCKGDYIALSDQDDIWMQDHLELLLASIPNYALSTGNALLINGDGESMGMTYWEQEAFDSIPSTNLGKAMSTILFRSVYQGASMMIKRDLLKYALPFPQSISYHDSWLAILACFCGGIICINKTITKYRRTEKSVTGPRNVKRSRYKQYRAHFIWNDKLDIVKDVYKRLENFEILTEKDIKFLKKMEKICERNNTTKGRWMNFIYTTIHYKTIYNSTFNSWK